MSHIYNVLFICSGNSARSQMAEALLNQLGKGRFKAFSAGSQPSGTVNPRAIEALQHAGVSTEGLRSKSWEEFSQPEAPVMNFVFTLCDTAAGEACPVWPGHPTKAHWGVKDPSQPEASEQQHTFQQTLLVLKRRIDLLTALPINKLDALALKLHVTEIGQAQ
jgi:arsenate reductase